MYFQRELPSPEHSVCSHCSQTLEILLGHFALFISLELVYTCRHTSFEFWLGCIVYTDKRPCLLSVTFYTLLSPCLHIQFCSVTQLCLTLCDPMDCSMPGLPVHQQIPELFKYMSIDSVMPSNHLILCHPLLLLPAIFPSIRVFSNKSVLSIRWPKYWSFSFSISPSNEYSGLISFRIDWFELLAVQGTLRSLLQHHSSKASICYKHMFIG